MKAVRRSCIVFVVLMTLLSIRGTAKAQADIRYFPETGHYVRGLFLQFYEAANDPQLVYGYPITEMITARDGKTVQYFQRARFELSGGDRVQLTPLGRLMYQPQTPLPVQSINGCESYATGYSVCFSFLDFYNSHGGKNQFGNPISPFESSNGRIVQYFEGARFEWRAGLGSEKWVVIADLGRQYFDQQQENPALLRPAPPPDATIKPILKINSRAFPFKAITLQSDTQSIYIIAQDQTLEPVQAANVRAVIGLTDGSKMEFTTLTNERGIAQINFNFLDQKPGELITVEVTITFQGLSSTTVSSFRIWF